MRGRSWGVEDELGDDGGVSIVTHNNENTLKLRISILI